MKVILVQINYTQDHSEKILPMGILSVGSELKRNGFDVELINITEKEITQTADYIINQKPLCVGLSVMTGIQTQHSAELSQKIKTKNNLPIIWGGVHPSLLPKECLKEDYIDYVVISEGEISALKLIKKIAEKNEPQNILGVGYKINNQIKINNPRSFIENLDDYELDFSLINLEDYIFSLGPCKRVIAYKTSRGCPFNCSFCYNYIFNKNKWRSWSVKSVISNIEFIKDKYKIDGIKFYDDNFFVDKSRALEILEKIDLPAHVELRIDSIDDNLAQKLKQFKCFDLLIGIESGSNRLLELIDKKFTVHRIIQGVKILAAHQVPASYSAIVGLPTETKQEFESTIDLFYKIYKIHKQSAFTLGAYLPYPGSRMYEFAKQHGFNPPNKTEDWGKIDRFRKDFKSPWVNTKKVWRIREYFKFLNWKLGPLIKWFESRIKHRFFSFPLDIYIIEFLSGIAIEQKGIIGKLMRKIYNRSD